MKLPLNSSQTIAIVAITAALAAGAYALGRSRGEPALEAPQSQAALPVAAPAVAPAALPPPVAVANAAPATPAPVAAVEPAAPAAPVICAGCSRVLDIHTEQRQVETTSGVGAIGGAVLGGLLGNRFGGGTGRKLATVGGAVAGGYAGNEIEKNGKTRRVWVVELKDENGHVHRREQASEPEVQTGDIVSVRDGRLVRR